MLEPRPKNTTRFAETMWSARQRRLSRSIKSEVAAIALRCPIRSLSANSVSVSSSSSASFSARPVFAATLPASAILNSLKPA